MPDIDARQDLKSKIRYEFKVEKKPRGSSLGRETKTQGRIQRSDNFFNCIDYNSNNNF